MHWDDPDCPPPGWERGMKKRPRSPRPANTKAVKYLKKRYRETGDMQPLAKVCDVLDNPRTRKDTLLHAAELAWEMAHGKIAPLRESPAVQVNQQVLQATSTTTEATSGQISTGDRARHLAGLLKATAVLGDVCEGSPPGGPAEDAGGAVPGGPGSPASGAGGSGGAGA